MMARQKELRPGKAFAELLGKLAQVPKRELDAQRQRERKRKSPKKK